MQGLSDLCPSVSLGSADLLIVLGSRLDIRQTGSDLASFCEGKQIWQIDIDFAEIGARVQPQHSLCCSISFAAQQLYSLCTPAKFRKFNSDWQQQINSLRIQFPASLEYLAEPGEINPVLLLQKLSRSVAAPCHYVTDVGQHQMWAAQSLVFSRGDRFLTSGGMGAMGFGLPAAIGAALANPDLVTILVSGDGSFQLNIQELETLKRNQVNLKIVLFNNQCHGMVRQFQESYFHGRLQSTAEGYSAPDFVKVSKAYSIPAFRLDAPKDVSHGLDWLLDKEGPSLLEVRLSIGSKVYPKLAFGRRFGEMEPETSPVAMEST